MTCAFDVRPMRVPLETFIMNRHKQNEHLFMSFGRVWFLFLYCCCVFGGFLCDCVMLLHFMCQMPFFSYSLCPTSKYTSADCFKRLIKQMIYFWRCDSETKEKANLMPRMNENLPINIELIVLYKAIDRIKWIYCSLFMCFCIYLCDRNAEYTFFFFSLCRVFSLSLLKYWHGSILLLLKFSLWDNYYKTHTFSRNVEHCSTE